MRAWGRLAFCLGLILAVPCRAQPYATLAGQPDPGDFVKRDGTGLTLQGSPLRFAGYDIGWLGFRSDGSPPATPPDAYEVRDALATVQALGGLVVRTRPAVGAGLASLDLILKTARDMGLKVIVPLAGGAGDCAAAVQADSICSTVRRHGQSDPNTFFTDPAMRAEFVAAVGTVLDHVNLLTGTAYRNDPTIMAWENCLACAQTASGAAASAWTEQVGQAIKAADPRHLYEDGALAGRLGKVPSPVPADAFATQSVDIVGDTVGVGRDPAAARDWLTETTGAVNAAGKVYVIDSAGWTAAAWNTVDDLSAWLLIAVKQRNLAGAVVGRLEGHATAGGYLPAPPAVPALGIAALYFPGIKTADMDAEAMQERGRALRRFAYSVADLGLAPAYLLPPKPEVIGAAHGHILWRGSAGAASYTIERSLDPSAPGAWEVVCDACATDLSGGWQDPKPPGEPAWYRIMPLNINGHKALPSDPIQATR